MSYFKQAVVAQGFVDGLEIIIREGLNYKESLELRIVVPKELHSVYEPGLYVYEQRGDLYFAEDRATGQVRFFAYSGPDTGFGGATYNLNMVDGSVATLKGPWSSRCSVMNAAGFKPSLEVSIASKYNMASAMTVERINELINELGYYCVVDALNGDSDLRAVIRELDEFDECDKQRIKL